jgi:hypothetical protein
MVTPINRGRSHNCPPNSRFTGGLAIPPTTQKKIFRSEGGWRSPERRPLNTPLATTVFSSQAHRSKNERCSFLYRSIAGPSQPRTRIAVAIGELVCDCAAMKSQRSRIAVAVSRGMSSQIGIWSKVVEGNIIGSLLRYF